MATEYRVLDVWTDEIDPETGSPVRDHDHYAVVRSCPFCANESRVVVPAQGLWDWQHGTLLQAAFSDLSADDREQLVTGIHPECWEQAFPVEDER